MMAMPYITFSRNFANEAKAYRMLSGIDDVVVERRGTKTIKDIANRASKQGFKSALLAMQMKGRTLKCRELKMSGSKDGMRWKYGEKPRTVDLSGK